MLVINGVRDTFWIILWVTSEVQSSLACDVDGACRQKWYEWY